MEKSLSTWCKVQKYYINDFIQIYCSNGFSAGVMEDASIAASVNINNDAEKRYSILNELEDFKSPEGEFRFMLCYPNHTPGQRIYKLGVN